MVRKSYQKVLYNSRQMQFVNSPLSSVVDYALTMLIVRRGLCPPVGHSLYHYSNIIKKNCPTECHLLLFLQTSRVSSAFITLFTYARVCVHQTFLFFKTSPFDRRRSYKVCHNRLAHTYQSFIRVHAQFKYFQLIFFYN